VVSVFLLVAAVVATQQPERVEHPWRFGGFVDVGYLHSFNHPGNKLFRSRGTTFHLDAVELNMAGAYVRRTPSEWSRWGAELFVHAGQDDEVFGFSATAPNMAGHEWLRHLGPANISYVAPVGKGLTVQGGIFTSLIGYDSLYAKDNANYTRSWGADFTPYLMMGANAAYPLTDKLIGTVYVVNGYAHLSHANGVPSSGFQLAYKATPKVTIKETVFWGPHQANTSTEFWRYLTDTIVEYRTDRFVAAVAAHFATEIVDLPERPRASWAAAQVPIRWNVSGPWSVAVRPEVAWDSLGRWTLAEQRVAALTSTLEYRATYKAAGLQLRLEHRVDVSRGPDGGFFAGPSEAAGVSLTPTQHLLILGAIFTFDSPPGR
jgi:hypothetical protein